MSTANRKFNKLMVCLCCSSRACGAGYYINCWNAIESFGNASLNEQACQWALCAPICHQCKMGDTKQAINRCSFYFRHWCFGCALCCVAPCDACYNMVCYNLDNCKTGVSSYKDIIKNTMWLGSKIQACLGLKKRNEPEQTMQTFKP